MAGLASIGQWDSWGTVGLDSVGYITVLSQYLAPGFAIFMVVIAVISNISVYNTYIASGLPRLLLPVRGPSGAPRSW